MLAPLPHKPTKHLLENTPSKEALVQLTNEDETNFASRMRRAWPAWTLLWTKQQDQTLTQRRLVNKKHALFQWHAGSCRSKILPLGALERLRISSAHIVPSSPETFASKLFCKQCFSRPYDFGARNLSMSEWLVSVQFVFQSVTFPTHEQ